MILTIDPIDHLVMNLIGDVSNLPKCSPSHSRIKMINPRVLEINGKTCNSLAIVISTMFIVRNRGRGRSRKPLFAETFVSCHSKFASACICVLYVAESTYFLFCTMMDFRPTHGKLAQPRPRTRWPYIPRRRHRIVFTRISQKLRRAQLRPRHR